MSTASGLAGLYEVETTEVARALQAQKICESTHGIAHEVFEREGDLI